MQIHTYAIDSGVDDLISTFPGQVRKLFFSPSGNSIAIALMSPEIQAAIMQSNKLIQSFAGWDVLGWASESEVILQKSVGAGYETDPSRELMAVGNIATGNIRQFYP